MNPAGLAAVPHAGDAIKNMRALAKSELEKMKVTEIQTLKKRITHPRTGRHLHGPGEDACVPLMEKTEDTAGNSCVRLCFHCQEAAGNILQGTVAGSGLQGLLQERSRAEALDWQPMSAAPTAHGERSPSALSFTGSLLSVTTVSD